MALSVPSDRTFLSAGITISKHPNWLKDNIIEALECIKCLLHCNFIFHSTIILEQIENKLKNVEVDEELEEFREIVAESEGFTWDNLLDDKEENTVE